MSNLDISIAAVVVSAALVAPLVTQVGTVVYMEWCDTDGSVLPFYAAHIATGVGFSGPDAQGGPGLYNFDLHQPLVNASGISHQRQARKVRSTARVSRLTSVTACATACFPSQPAAAGPFRRRRC